MFSLIFSFADCYTSLAFYELFLRLCPDGLRDLVSTLIQAVSEHLSEFSPVRQLDVWLRWVQFCLLHCRERGDPRLVYISAMLMPEASRPFLAAEKTKKNWLPSIPKRLRYTRRTKPKNLSPTLMHLKGHSGVVTSVAFSPDGKHVVSGSNDRNIFTWRDVQNILDPENGKMDMSIVLHADFAGLFEFGSMVL